MSMSNMQSMYAYIYMCVCAFLCSNVRCKYLIHKKNKWGSSGTQWANTIISLTVGRPKKAPLPAMNLNDML